MFQRDEPGVSPFLSPFFNRFCPPRQISCHLGFEPRLNAINELPWGGEEARQPPTFKVEWSFDGIRYFISHSEHLAASRNMVSAIAGCSGQ